MTSKIRFSDHSGGIVSVPSDWRDVKVTSISCQTDEALYQFNEQETQTGIATEIVGDEVKAMGRSQADRLITDMDLIGRDEFEVLKEMLLASRAEVEVLTKRIEALEKK